MRQRLIPILLAFSLAPWLAAMAGDARHDHGDQHEAGHHDNAAAHTHGIATLQLILDGTELALVLQSPAMNLTGFEHRARNAEERAVVERVRRSLSDPAGTWHIVGGDCAIASHRVDIGEILDIGEVLDSPDRHDDHQHAEHEPAKPGHSDIEAHYRYRCSEPQQLERIDAALLAEFRAIQALEVQWIVHGRQGATTLSPNNREIDFR